MKKFLPLLHITSILLFYSCGMSKQELTNQVINSMKEEFSKNKNVDVEIVSLVLVKKSENEYLGTLETSESVKSPEVTGEDVVSIDGELPKNIKHTYEVEVLSDGDSFRWKIKNGFLE